MYDKWPKYDNRGNNPGTQFRFFLNFFFIVEDCFFLFCFCFCNSVFILSFPLFFSLFLLFTRATKRGVGGGFGPVADDGYGVCYLVRGENSLVFHVSSKKSCPTTDSSKFVADLMAGFDDIMALYD